MLLWEEERKTVKVKRHTTLNIRQLEGEKRIREGCRARHHFEVWGEGERKRQESWTCVSVPSSLDERVVIVYRRHNSLLSFHFSLYCLLHSLVILWLNAIHCLVFKHKVIDTGDTLDERRQEMSTWVKEHLKFHSRKKHYSNLPTVSSSPRSL